MNFTHFAVLIRVRPARMGKAKCYSCLLLIMIIMAAVYGQVPLGHTSV